MVLPDITSGRRARNRPYPGQVGEARTYEIRTYGCQMNAHDSERVAGLLEDAGYARAPDGRDPRPGGVQHVRRQGERGRPALRQPRPPAAREEGARGDADRRRRLPGADGAGADHQARPLGRRGLRHAQHRRRCRSCSSGARSGARRRWSSRRPSPPSRRCCRPAASRPTRPGCRSPSAATTPAPSASSRRCAGPSATAARVTSSRRSASWSTRASSRSRCSART